MTGSRRDCLRLGLLAGSGALLAGCSEIARQRERPALPERIGVATPADDPVIRLMNRAGFGPAPGSGEKVRAIGLPRYIEAQLSPDDGDEGILTARLRGIEVLRENAMEMTDQPEHEVLRQAEQAALLRAVYSRHQLRERMADFWSNHFNIYAYKGFGAYLIPTAERETIRRNALGRFPDLLRASTRSPAMLAYLDNQVNRRGVPNGDYARELMELHTLGVDGGYTQQDVQEVARCLTGWTIENRFLRSRGTFRFDSGSHDRGEKRVLGQRIPAGGGIDDGERVLSILAGHPATAVHIAGKLCRCFLGENSTADRWTPRLAGIYRKTGGDIPAMLRPLLLSDDLANSPPMIKRPLDFVVSALRALGANTDGGRPLQEHLRRMGQPLYQWPMPDGYPDRVADWKGSLLARWNFAFDFVAGGIPGTGIDAAGLLEALRSDSASDIVGLVFSRPDVGPLRVLRDGLDTHLNAASRDGIAGPRRLAEATALLLASPEFQWR